MTDGSQLDMGMLEELREQAGSTALVVVELKDDADLFLHVVEDPELGGAAGPMLDMTDVLTILLQSGISITRVINGLEQATASPTSNQPADSQPIRQAGEDEPTDDELWEDA